MCNVTVPGARRLPCTPLLTQPCGLSEPALMTDCARLTSPCRSGRNATDPAERTQAGLSFAGIHYLMLPAGLVSTGAG